MNAFRNGVQVQLNFQSSLQLARVYDIDCTNQMPSTVSLPLVDLSCCSLYSPSFISCTILSRMFLHKSYYNKELSQMRTTGHTRKEPHYTTIKLRCTCIVDAASITTFKYPTRLDRFKLLMPN